MDLLLSSDGDLVVADGALSLTPTPAQEKSQMVMSRVKTSNPDWFHHPRIGADLEELYGEPCTRETAQKGIDQITTSLTYDGYFLPSQVQVEAVPHNDSIDYFISVIDSDTKEPVVLYLNLPLI